MERGRDGTHRTQLRGTEREAERRGGGAGCQIKEERDEDKLRDMVMFASAYRLSGWS